MSSRSYVIKAEVRRGDPVRSLCVVLLKVAGFLTTPVDHRGLYHVAKLLSGRLAGASGVVIADNEICFRFPLDDPYWARLLGKNYCYEPEMWALLRRAGELKAGFLDAGANRGLWSAVAVQEGLAPVVAIEPGQQAAVWLEQTRHLSGDRFRTVTAAVTDRDDGLGRFVDSVDEAKSGSGLSDLEQDGAYSVELRTVDGIAGQYFPEHMRGLAIVKLDVEGAEIPAIAGSMKLVQAGSVLVVEDHGKDPTCAVTAFLFAHSLRVAVFRRGRFEEISGVDDLVRIKTRRSRGYNVLAGSRDSALFNQLLTA